MLAVKRPCHCPLSLLQLLYVISRILQSESPELMDDGLWWNLAKHSSDGTGPGFNQQLAPSNFIKIDTFNLQTVSMGCTRYTSLKLQTQHATAHHYPMPHLPWKTVATSGAQHHILNELNRHFRGMVCKLRKL